GEPVRARPTPAWERAWKWCRRRPTQAALAAVGVLLVVTALVVALLRQHLEKQRLADVRDEVARLVQEGQDALVRDDVDTAQERFRVAWMRVQAEPALGDEQTHVAGWLDHSRRAVNRHRWKQRIPPR